MLAKFGCVSREGEFATVCANAARLGFGGMLGLRVQIFVEYAYCIARVATIAIRYSLVRR